MTRQKQLENIKDKMINMKGGVNLPCLLRSPTEEKRTEEEAIHEGVLSETHRTNKIQNTRYKELN